MRWKKPKTEEVRERVSRSYARAVSGPDGSCCGTASCGDVLPKGEAAKVAGYDKKELAALPPEVVTNSFGCGNPLAFADVREGETVLDLGSGAGIDILLGAQRVGSTGRVIGIDMTDEMISRAERAISQSGLTNVEVRKGLIEKLPVASDSVDLVISNCVINLSPEKRRVFAEISRVLKPGGRISVSDIVVENLPAWLRRVPAVYNSCVGGAISEGEYLDGLKQAGLEQVQVTERLIYGAEQLAALALSEGPSAWKSVARVLPIEFLVRRLANRLEGNIWSARFVARAPIGEAETPEMGSPVVVAVH